MLSRPRMAAYRILLLGLETDPMISWKPGICGVGSNGSMGLDLRLESRSQTR